MQKSGKQQFAKRLLIWTLCFAFIFSFTLPQRGEARTELEKIEREIAQIQQRMQEAKRNSQMAQMRMAQIDAEKGVIIQDIHTINQRIEEAVARLMELEEEISQQENELLETEYKLEQAIQRIHDRDQLLRSRLHLMYTNGAVSYLEVLLQATSFMDFIDRYNALKSLVSQDKEILESNKRDKEYIERHKEHVETLLASLEENYNEAEAVRIELLNQRKEREVRIASLNAEERNLEHILEEEEEALMQAARKEQELQQKKEELEAFYKGGKLAYPLPRAYRITSGFGTRTDPITGQRGVFHSGIDFGAPGGTDVLAAEGGRVLVAEWYGGYGNTVIINHGQGLWTLYAHLRNNSITVKVGDVVQRGDKIGEVGTTGRSTGNHLHFEVRLNSERVDPSDYLNL